MARCEGWYNRQTWNVSLYIKNEERLYRLACDLAKQPYPYKAFAECMRARGIYRTPDGVSYTDSRLCRTELNELIRSFREDK